jgi:hypothetical protein
MATDSFDSRSKELADIDAARTKLDAVLGQRLPALRNRARDAIENGDQAARFADVDSLHRDIEAASRDFVNVAAMISDEVSLDVRPRSRQRRRPPPQMPRTVKIAS